MGGTIDAGRDLAQGILQFGGVGFAHRQLRLRFQTGQRGPHLVRGVGNEAMLRLQVAAHPLQHRIEGVDQRLQLLRHASRPDRRKIVLGPRLDPLAQARQWLQALREAKPHKHDGQRNDHELRQDDAGDDLV